jgi:mono/diheme cytochrome c family protein
MLGNAVFAQSTFGPTTGDAAAGATLYSACSGCHGASANINIPIRNAANAGWVINLAMANGMGGYNDTSRNSTQEADLAAYISNLFSSTNTNPVNQPVAHNSGGTAFALPNIYLSTAYGGFSSIQTVSSPSRGSVSYVGATATYTPSTSQCGTDSFSWRATGTFNTPPANGVDTYFSNNRTSSVFIANPAAPNISTSASTLTGAVGVAISTYSPVNTGAPSLSYALAGTVPGLSFNTTTGQITGTPTQAGTYNVSLTGRNCFNGNLAGQSSAGKAITITINPGPQTITFSPVPPKVSTAAPFSVSATGGGSGNPVTFTASGVCTVSGSTVTLSGAVGTCTITGNQMGNADYANATPATLDIQVVASGEVFPPNCQIPLGWTTSAGAQTGWDVASDSVVTGSCSLKSNPVAVATAGTTNKAQIQFTATFLAGNISFQRRVSSEQGWDCFRVFIDGAAQALGAPNNGCFGPDENGHSGFLAYAPVNVPITAGSHTVIFSYETDDLNEFGEDAAWIDNLTLPLAPPTITSSLTASGQVGIAFSYQATASNAPWGFSATDLPPGFTISHSGLITGTAAAVGTYTVMLTATSGAGTVTQALTLTINKGPQIIPFAAITNKPLATGLFVLPAITGGGSGNPVTYTASGPCNATGMNGSTIQFTGSLGTCSVTANQLGDANYLNANPVSQSFLIYNPSEEFFPANCSFPAGWSSSGAGWTVQNDSASGGGCSLKSNSDSSGTGAVLQYSGNFAAGNVRFSRRTNMASTTFIFTFIESCFRFYIDGVLQNIGGGNCAGSLGQGGYQPFAQVSVPISAGFHTLRWETVAGVLFFPLEYTAWIDDIIFPQFTLSVAKAGGGTGTVSSVTPGINCGATCSATFAANTLVNLTANPAMGSYLSSWSGGGCSGSGSCFVSMTGSQSVTATFSLITVPGAPTGVAAAPGNTSASVSFTPPAFNGGSTITSYRATCGSTFADGPGSPVVVPGLVNGVSVTCTVSAANAAGRSLESSPPVAVTPRTVPSVPQNFAVAPGNASAILTFTAPANNGGSAVTSYIAACFEGSNAFFGSSMTVAPITITGLTNGTVYMCRMAANNAAGQGAIAGDLPVTPRTVPGSPTNDSRIVRDGRAIFSFDAPMSNGGSPILNYTVTCTGIAPVTGAASPITVFGLTNGMSYNCEVVANNAAGAGPAKQFASFAPGVQTGATYWTQVCMACHTTPTPGLPQLNAAGTTAAVLNNAIATQPLMSMNSEITALTQNERIAIAQYLATARPEAMATTAFNTPVVVDLASQLTLGTVSFETMETVGTPSSGTLSMLSGTQITFTPAAGFVGTATFQVRGARAMPMMLQGDPITVTVTVNPPPAPVINSPLTATGTNGVMFSYPITATNSPTSYAAFGLPGGLSINTMTGLISGTPSVGGSFMVDIRATNAGGNGDAVLVLTLNPAAQSITFPAQTPGAFAFAPSGNFSVNPVATASSTLPVSYTSLTPAVCTLSAGSTFTMQSAGTCTVAANQAGDANFAAAPQVTRDVTITPTLPSAPTIGAATPGNNQATIAFSAPGNTGGVPISGYTASCTPTGLGTGMVSPITIAGLSNGTTYTCSVKATNSVGDSPSSGTVMVTPAPTPTPPAITSVSNATFTVGQPGSFNITATGTPAVFTFSATGTLPMGVTLNTMTGNLSGTPTQAGMFPITIGVTNGVMPNASQGFTLTVNQANQTISFTGPASQSLSVGSVTVAASATSGLAVSFASTTMSTCTVSGNTVTLIATGTCTVRASQGGNANFNPAPNVDQSFTITQGTQSINFPAQTTSSRTYSNGGTFMLSPTASASSALPVTYQSLTQSVCTIASTNVTMVRAGICTIAANQAGNGNFAAAAQVTQSITINGTVPGAPTLNSATGGDTKITLAFTAPANDGGSSIVSYTATCGAATATGSGSPIAVTGLSNGMSYSCTVAATNATGTGGNSGSLMATPNTLPGAALWSSNCSACHTATPNTFRLNVGGSTAAVLDHVVTNMTGQSGLLGIMVTTVNSLSAQNKIDIAQYIREFIPAVSATTPQSTAVDINVGSQVFLNTTWAALTDLQQASAPTNGTLSFPGGTTIRYTPNMGFAGTDTFTYRGFNGGVQTDVRTVTVTVTPAAPVITSSLNVSSTVGAAFIYQIAATNAPTSYAAPSLPAGLSVNTMTGAITGMPSATGSASYGISASNAGGAGPTAMLTITINGTPQVISFPAQTMSSRPFNIAPSNTFAISPIATGGASMNPVTYSSTTSSVCSVSGTTVTMIASGVCTIAANQAGNATFAAAAQVTQSVTIAATAPGAPTIGAGTAGNTQATVNFTAPANNGGLTITSYTASCNGITNTGAGSPITVSGLTNGVTYTCSVQATNGAGTSPASGTVMITPVAIAFTGTVYSRKQHGMYTGNLDIDETAAFNAASIEPRGIGSGHQIVFVFNNPVSSANVSVTDAMDAPIMGASASASFNVNELIVTVTGVADKTRVKVKATGVNGALNVETPIAFLYGDVNQTGKVTAADISAIKAKSGAMTVDGTTYLRDINVNGGINNTDVSAVKAKAGNVLP